MTKTNGDLIYPVENKKTDIITPIIDNFHKINKDSVKEIYYKEDKMGNEILEINLKNGQSIKASNFISGITEHIQTNVPKFKNIEERNTAIHELKKQGKTQKETSRIIGISQQQISEILKKQEI